MKNKPKLGPRSERLCSWCIRFSQGPIAPGDNAPEISDAAVPFSATGVRELVVGGSSSLSFLLELPKQVLSEVGDTGDVR